MQANLIQAKRNEFATILQRNLFDTIGLISDNSISSVSEFSLNLDLQCTLTKQLYVVMGANHFPSEQRRFHVIPSESRLSKSLIF